jgi:hypothetical protein
MRTTGNKIARTLLPVATGACCMVTLLVAMTAITDFGHPTPHIGDIVSFIASSGQPVVSQWTGVFY